MARCRSCQTPILWRRTTNTGNPQPFDLRPADNGNVVFNPDGTATILNRDQAAQARDAGAELRVSHFATCPNAASHRKRATS